MTTISQPDVAIIDFRLNNLTSISRGLELAGAGRVRVVRSPKEVDEASHLVLPGVGNFATAMGNLVQGEWPSFLQAERDRRPLLGICLGMQLLFEESDEGGNGGPSVPGLGLLPGRVTRLPAGHGQRVPHVGWNTVSADDEAALFVDMRNDLDFYFVHSYAYMHNISDVVVARTPFGQGQFASAVTHKSVAGVQFHPEKSSQGGLQLLANFLRIVAC